jgi:hypothetical protein
MGGIAMNLKKNHSRESEYFVIGNTRIRVTEHFADDGRTIDGLIEDVIRYAAGQVENEKKNAA